MRPPLSRRISQVEVSPTLALNAKAKELTAQGMTVLNFAVGEPDFGTATAVVDQAVKALRQGHTKYGPAGGTESFRKAIAQKLKVENGLSFDPRNIVCGFGAKELLFHLFLALINDGDEVILSAPYWVSYADQVRAAGGVPICIPMPEGKGSLLDVGKISQYASERTVAYVLCSPNNPAGYVVSQEELRELGAYLSQKPWWVISDEVYEYMTFGVEHTSLLQLCPQLQDRFILVNSMSKSFAMTGWRVGYTAGPAAVMGLVRNLQSHSSTCLPPFIEEAATWAIAQGRGLMADALQELGARRDLALACLREIPEVGYIQPQGAFYLFVDVRDVLRRRPQFAEGKTLAFSQYLLEKHHLAVVPGEAFGAPGYLRFSYACDPESIKAGFKRLASAVQ